MELKYDVLVVGAGASGIPAAIAAAREGAKVLLLDEDPVIGGAPVDAYVCMFCGGPRVGIVKEIEDALKDRHSLTPNARWFLPAAWQNIYHELLVKAGVTVLTGARVVDVLLDETGDRPSVKGVSVERFDHSLHLAAAVTIDATGTGAVVLAAGGAAMYGEDSREAFGEELAPKEPTETVQHVTWMYISQKIGNAKTFDMMKLENVERGVLVNGVGWFHRDPDKAMEKDPGVYLHWGCSVLCTDTRDPVRLGQAQQDAREAMERDWALLRENGYAVYLAPKIGVREQSRIVGEHVVTLNDLASGEYPEDMIAPGNYDVDLWGKAKAGMPYHGNRLPPYGIPYRALLPKGVDGLLVAGKAISGTHISMSAYRVMPIVGAIGQSAGVGAALCGSEQCRPRDMDPKTIQEAVRKPAQNLHW